MKQSNIKWIGAIPKKWSVKRLKYCLCTKDGGIWGENPTDETINAAVLRSTEQNIDGEWKISDPEIRGLTNSEFKGAKLLADDLVMTKSSGSLLHIGKTSIVTKDMEKKEYCFSNFMQRLRVTNDNSAKYFWYCLNSIFVRSQYDYLSNTTTGLSNINTEMIESVFIPAPSLIEQQSIASYLDIKCRKIDSTIMAIENQIDTMYKYKNSLIKEFVTKGIVRKAATKDSNVDWVGKISSTWETTEIRYLFKQVKSPNILNEEKNLLSLSYGEIIKKDIEISTGLLPDSFDTYNIICSGDIVLRLTDLQNDQKSLRVGYSKEKGIITSAYLTLRLLLKSYSSKYYYYLLHSFDLNKVFYGMGAGVRQSIGWDELKRSIIFVPPVKEQYAIADYLDIECAKIEDIIKDKQEALETLKEYKKSLIYEYVTGKKRVKEAK